MPFIIVIFLNSILLITMLEARPSHPFPSHQNYYNSILVSEFSQKTVDNHVRRFYDIWKKDFLVKVEKTYRIASDKKDKHRTVSEGQGYGMMIIAYMAGYDKDAQEIFDGMYLFAQHHPSALHKELMTWQVPAKEKESDSAFDGDVDIAFALLLADKQWGSQGKINYKEEAKRRIDAIMMYTIGSKSFLPLLGDWVEEDGKKYNQYTTRSSDFMLSHFKTFYAFTKDKRWLNVVNATQKALKDIQTLPQNKTALVSDFLYYDHKKKHFLPTKRTFLETEDNSYYYNACRVPWRISVDALLNHDLKSRQIVQDMLYWIYKSTKTKAQNIKSGYRLDGSVIGDYATTAFIAPFGVAAKSDQNMQKFLDDIYTRIYNKHENYYEDSINLLCLLIISENYWQPKY